MQNADAYTTLHFSLVMANGMARSDRMPSGPVNIRTAVGQFFAEFGPFQVVTTDTVQLSPDLVMADVYQRTRGQHAFGDTAKRCG